MSEKDDTEAQTKKGQVWMPVCTDPNSEDYNPSVKDDEDVKELDLP